MRSLRNFLLLGGSQTLPERPSTQQSHSSSEIPKGPECPGPESEKQGHSFKPQSGWKAHFQIPCRIPHLVFSTGDKEDLTWTIDPNLPPSSILPSFSIINTCPKNLSSQCHNSFMCSWKSRSCGLCMANPLPGANFSRFINRITTAEKKSHSRSLSLLPVNSLL